MSIPRNGLHNLASVHPAPPGANASGRIYAVPFVEAWRAAVFLAATLPGWSVTAQDPRAGRIKVSSVIKLWNTRADVEVRLWLDEAGMTRVRAASNLREGRFDFGVNARRIDRFLQRLDQALRRRR